MIWLETSGSTDSSYARCASSREFIEMQRQGKTEEFVASLEWFRPLLVEFRPDEQWTHLGKLLERYGLATATIVGRLDHEEGSRVTRGANGSFGLTGGYGHLNGFSRRIVIERVENVERDRR